MSETAALRQKIKLSGIRLSSELTLARFSGIDSSTDPVAYLCQSLASRKVSILFLSSSYQEAGLQIDCCVESGLGGIIEATIQGDRLLNGKSEVVKAVGLLTVYPHRSSFPLIGCLMEKLWTSGVPIFAMTTSIAAVTAVIPYHELDRAAAVVAAGFDLPENHTPLRADFVVQPSTIEDR
jgi:hypothetical protein